MVVRQGGRDFLFADRAKWGEVLGQNGGLSPAGPRDRAVWPALGHLSRGLGGKNYTPLPQTGGSGGSGGSHTIPTGYLFFSF